MSAPASAGLKQAAAQAPVANPALAVMETYARRDVAFERGEGSWLMTAAGERYLDFASGVAVNALGHSHPALVAALTEQAQKLWHTSNLYRVSGQEALAERLSALTFADKVFFCNSGAEACEGAIKAARRYHFVNGRPQRTRIITFHGAFHGRTLTTLAAGGNAKYLEGFGPEAPGFDHVPLGDLSELTAAIGPETAAIMLEPIQGEGGVRVVEPQMLRDIRALCDAHGLLLVLDEVQSGMGRTGKLFAHEWAGITPDIMAIAKGLGGGFPVGAFLANQAVADAMTPGTHGSTFGGNLLAMAVGNAVLDIVAETAFLAEVQQKALRMKQALEAVKDQHRDKVAEVRGLGLLMGLKLKDGFVPADLVAAASAEKMLVVGAGDNVVRILPPLTASPEEIAEGANRLTRALDRITAKST